jgi:SNF2 family DNA or RNA helicase
MPLTAEAEKQLAATYEQLKKVRESKTISLKPCPSMRDTIVGLGGEPEPFNLRYYQCQGIYHLMLMRRMVLGDGTGLGKTIEAIGAFCYLWMKETDSRVVIVTPKTALRQWEGEIYRFTKGVRVYVVEGSLESRERIYRAWAKHPPNASTKPVLLVNYHILIRDWNQGARIIRPEKGKKGKPTVIPGMLQVIMEQAGTLLTIYDECQAFKNTATKTWQVCSQLSGKSKRVYGLTATLLKNNLMEGYSIYKVICPWVFTTKTAFLDSYCVTKMQPVAGGRKIPVVVGYRNLQHFRQVIDPYFLGRPKHAVSSELPTLVTKEVTCELSAAEDVMYGQALLGILSLGDGDVRDYSEHAALVSLNYCQQVVNSLSMLKYKEGDEIFTDILNEEVHRVSMGAKESALVELLTEELEGEKVIVYTKFESLVDRLRKLLAKEKVKSVRITGKENQTKRKEAQTAFQDLTSDTKVVFITDAGSEAINLQAASAIIFYDSPWSWGNYVQTLGRPVRIGSIHANVLVYHLIAERPREGAKERKTIDHHVLTLLRSKKRIVDAVLGEAAVGALTFEKENRSAAKELVKRLKENGG